MALIKAVNNIMPRFGRDCYLADNATIVGDVIIGDECSIWFNAVIRGDVNLIRIGHRVNIQDGAVLHCLYKKSVIHIGNNVTLGHNAVIHGATIHDHVLVGMGAIILDHAVIGENSIIAAGALILEGMMTEPGSIYAGVPARKVKEVDPEQTRDMIQTIAENYLMYAGWYRENQ